MELAHSPGIVPTQDALVFTRALLPQDEAEMRFFLLGAGEGIEKVGISAIEMVDLGSRAVEEALASRLCALRCQPRRCADSCAPRSG